MKEKHKQSRQRQSEENRERGDQPVDDSGAKDGPQTVLDMNGAESSDNIGSARFGGTRRGGKGMRPVWRPFGRCRWWGADVTVASAIVFALTFCRQSEALKMTLLRAWGVRWGRKLVSKICEEDWSCVKRG